MQSFQVYIPIQKGEPGRPYKITETMPSGETRTRYRLHGVASTTGLDRDSERVTRGCIEGMVGAIKSKKLPIFGNHQHDWENMLGYADNAEALNKEMEIDILTAYVETHPKVGQLVSDLEAGLPLGLSIGGKVIEKDSAYEPALKKNITVIKKIGVLETSVVGIGSNEDAFLSLPEQISKSLKPTRAREASYLDNTEKQAGQGMLEMPQQQPVQTCPECGKPAELRQLSNGGAVYFCPNDGTLFEVIAQEKKIIAAPISQPAKMPLENIEQQQQKPLGGSKKGLNSSLHTKKTTGGLFMKKQKEGEEEEDESSKQNSEEEEEETSEEKTKKKKTAKEVAEEKPDKDEEEKSYKTFVKFMARFKKEATSKTEGVDEEPGEENADAENTVGGSGGAGTVANSKSAKDFNTMKKAFKENVGAEGLEKGKPDAKDNDLSFKSMRKDQMERK